jgi:hypothetical protein
MANEITLTASLSLFKALIMEQADGDAVTNFIASMSGNFYTKGVVLIATSAGTAIPLGQVVAPHWAFFKNMDPVNSVTIRNGSGGADLLQMLAGEPAFCPLLSTCVPWGIATGGAINLKYLIISL